VAVVITCETALLISNFNSDGIDSLQTALGLTFSMKPHQRIRLKRKNRKSNIVNAAVLKNLTGKRGSAEIMFCDKNGLLDAKITIKSNHVN
jgi:hypothetical protein